MPVTADRCPGVLRLHQAADGGLARVRLPGGLITGAQVMVLAAAAADLGDPRLELTSRGNVQVRALTAAGAAELEVRLSEAGLLPSRTHERVRNIVASPLAGIDRPLDLGPYIRELDRQLCAQPELTELSGRFRFGLDDGRGDIASLGPDVLAVIDGSISPADIAAAATAQARTALDATPAEHVRSGPAERPVGLVPRWDGGWALVVLAPLGRLDQAQARWLAAAGSDALRVTPWRSIVLPHAGAADTAQAERYGLAVTSGSAWVGVTACAGRPRCAKALADVQRDAADRLGRFPGRVVHWSGCERRCGRPGDTQVDVVATGSGYQIEGDADA